MAIYGACILLRGLGSCPQLFRCESIPSPQNLTYILPYDCPCFAPPPGIPQFFHFRRPLNCLPVNLSTCRPVDLSSCRPVNMSTWQPVNLAIYGVCIPSTSQLSTCQPVNILTCQPRLLSTCRHVNMSTWQPVNLSDCQLVDLLTFCWLLLVYNTPHPVTLLYMEYAFCCWEYEGLAPNALRCESMPTPLNLTYNPSYDCPWFACMRISFTSVDMSTCQPVYL